MDFRIRENDGKGSSHYSSFPCNSVANASSLLTVANASGSDLTLHFRVHPWQMHLLCWPRQINKLGSFCCILMTINSRFVAYCAECKCEDLMKIVFQGTKI